MLLLPGQSPPPHSSPQAGTFCEISAHERPATGPSRLPQTLRTVPRPLAPSPLPIHHRVAPSRPAPPATALPKDLPEHVSVAPSESHHESVSRAQRRPPPQICRAEGSERTHARPSALSHQRRALTQDEKRGESLPPHVIAFSASKSAIARQDYSSLPSSARAKSCGSNGRRSSIFSPRPTKVMGSSN